MGEALRPGPLMASAFVDKQAVFTASLSFRGPVDNFVFKLGTSGIGYYFDDPAAAVADFIREAEPCLESAVLAYIGGTCAGGRTPPPTVISIMQLMKPAVLLAKRLPRVRGKRRPKHTQYKCEQPDWIQPGCSPCTGCAWVFACL